MKTACGLQVEASTLRSAIIGSELVRLSESVRKIEKAYSMLRKQTKANVLPVQPNVDLLQESKPFDDPHHYRQVMGLLNYIAQISRPEAREKSVYL